MGIKRDGSISELEEASEIVHAFDKSRFKRRTEGILSKGKVIMKLVDDLNIACGIC